MTSLSVGLGHEFGEIAGVYAPGVGKGIAPEMKARFSTLTLIPFETCRPFQS